MYFQFLTLFIFGFSLLVLSNNTGDYITKKFQDKKTFLIFSMFLL